MLPEQLSPSWGNQTSVAGTSITSLLQNHSSDPWKSSKSQMQKKKRFFNSWNH